MFKQKILWGINITFHTSPVKMKSSSKNEIFFGVVFVDDVVSVVSVMMLMLLLLLLVYIMKKKQHLLKPHQQQQQHANSAWKIRTLNDGKSDINIHFFYFIRTRFFRLRLDVLKILVVFRLERS